MIMAFLVPYVQQKGYIPIASGKGDTTSLNLSYCFSSRAKDFKEQQKERKQDFLL